MSADQLIARKNGQIRFLRITGRAGFTINATSGIPVCGALSHRSASRKLIRATLRC
jgi:hypothetical protein